MIFDGNQAKLTKSKDLPRKKYKTKKMIENTKQNSKTLPENSFPVPAVHESLNITRDPAI